MLSPLFLVRHGSTEWSVAGRHTGVTDLPLTAAGRREVEALAARLADTTFRFVVCSPARRARQSAGICAPGVEIRVDDDLVEWRYGEYEGMTSPQILEQRPGWELWTDGTPGGESFADVARRADRVLGRLNDLDGPGLVVAHGHMNRVLTERYLGVAGIAARLGTLRAGSLSVLGIEKSKPALLLWNDTSHLPAG